MGRVKPSQPSGPGLQDRDPVYKALSPRPGAQQGSEDALSDYF